MRTGRRNAKNMEQKSEFAHRIGDRIELFSEKKLIFYKNNTVITIDKSAEIW
jgi:hypothetical protein